MKHGLRKIIFGAIFAAVVGGGNFFVGAPEVRAANTDCCVYTLVSSPKPPAWLTALGDASNVFVDGKVGTPCKKPSEVVVLSQKKIDKYYNNNDDEAIAGDCSKTQDYKDFVAAAAKTECCQVNNGTDVLRGCVDINKANVAKSEVAASCILAAHSKFMPDDKILAFNKSCSAVTACQDLQKKFDDQKAANKIADAQSAEIEKRMQDGIAGKKKSWTKEECGAVLRKDSSEPAYIWVPPKATPNVITGNHCYIRSLPTKLQVNMGSTSVITGLPEYINVAYKYGLGFGVIVMIVVIVFSGIQWMLSGIASSINDSKERIKNAALGLLLLFAANTILYTINPQLLNLKLPLMQAIRPETFSVESANEGTRCDPAEVDSCSKKGPNFKCKPTGHYVSTKCTDQANVLLAGVFAAAAITAAAPFVVSAGVAYVTEVGAGVILRRVATEVVIDQVVDVATGGTGNAASGATAAISGAGGIKTAVVVVAAIFGGLAIADGLFTDDAEDAEDKSKPALGYCVPLEHNLPDHSVCQADGDCVSNKCLFTSKGACGAGNFGVCTSGNLRQACVIPKIYSLGFFDVGNVDEAKKYSCASGQGSCVDNGRGVAKKGISMCSDGSDIGMPCGDGMSCSAIKNLECSNGFCREKGFFGTSGKTNGLVMYVEDNKPRCMLPTDCSDNKSVMTANDFQNTIIFGCLKPPAPELKLPGRFLISQVNQKLDSSFYVELSTYGVCASDKPKFKQYVLSSGDPKYVGDHVQSCYVNFYPTSQFDPDSQTIANYLTSKQLMLTGKFAIFDIKKVGCGKVGVCAINPYSIASAVGNDTFKTVAGKCQDELSSDVKAAIVKNNKGSDVIGVVEPDKWYSGVKIPNIIDIQYTNAGSPQGS